MSIPRKKTSTNYLNQGVLRQACIINDTLTRLSARWKVQLLYCIHQGENRFSLLKDAFPSISDQMLGTRLRELEQEGLVTKQTECNVVPVQVQYFATVKGIALLTIMEELTAWEQTFN
jgi:DNA-binding HxlR family transcriptional regulator